MWLDDSELLELDAAYLFRRSFGDNVSWIGKILFYKLLRNVINI